MELSFAYKDTTIENRATDSHSPKKCHGSPFPDFDRTADAGVSFRNAVHASLADIAAGEFVRQPGGISRIDQLMRQGGSNEAASNQGWTILRKYKDVFEYAVFQSVVIGFNSHWDWYIRRLCEFIRFARLSYGGPSLSSLDEKRLMKAGRLPIVEQMRIVELAAGISMSLDADDRCEISELALVRNLGLHNR